MFACHSSLRGGAYVTCLYVIGDIDHTAICAMFSACWLRVSVWLVRAIDLWWLKIYWNSLCYRNSYDRKTPKRNCNAIHNLFLSE